MKGLIKYMTMNIDAAERQYLINQYMTEGRDTYAGRLDAWHKLGEVSGNFRTWKEMLSAAKADFEVFKSQLKDSLGRDANAWGTFRWNADSRAKWIAAKNAGDAEGMKAAMLESRMLGTVGNDYKVIQHTDGFDLLDELVEQVDGAHYETMGVIDFGRIVWGQVDPNVKIRVGDDVSDVFLTFHTSHDGSKAFDIFETGTREVCRNTFRIGSLTRLAASLRIRHTKNADKRIKDLKAEIAEIRSKAMSIQDKLTFLSRKRVTKDSMLTLLDRLFPKTETETGEKSSTRRDNVLAQILELYESNDGNAFPEQRGTAYNLLNAITEYADHYRLGGAGKSQERALSAQFGTGAKLKALALDEILGAAKEMPEVITRGVGGLGADVVGEMLLK